MINDNVKDNRIAYGAACLWWGDIGKVGSRSGLPCCPYCKGLLFEEKSPEDWWKGVDEYVAEGHPGYHEFIEWIKEKCMKYPEAKIAYERETGKVL